MTHKNGTNLASIRSHKKRRRRRPKGAVVTKFFPDSKKSQIVFHSSAEEHLYSAAREQLSDGWHVFHSVTISSMENKEGLKDNEIDFVFYHAKHGIVVVEVKGGRIRFDATSQKFYSVNRLDAQFEIKNPFQQILVVKNRLIRMLRDENIRVPVSHAVCFPSVEENDFPSVAGIESEVIIGKNRLKRLEETLSAIVRKSQPEKYLSFTDCSKSLVDLLVGKPFTTKLYLRDYIESHESRVNDTESILESLLTPVAGQKRLGIEGEAGTGKTILGVTLAKRFRDQGKRVLFLSSNPTLNERVREDLDEKKIENIDVKNYLELAVSFGVNLVVPPQNFPKSNDEWTQIEAPVQFKKAVSESKSRYDVIICDEGQDVQPFWWDGIEALLTHAEESNLYIFFDRSQGIFGSGGSEKLFVPEKLLPVPANYFPLVHNYRNTREIAIFARKFRAGTQILQSHADRVGYVPVIVEYESVEEAKKLLERLTTKLIKEEHLKADEICIISGRNPDAKESVLHGVDILSGHRFHRVTGRKKDASEEQKISLSTIASFKGLETKVGIIVNLSEYNMPITNPIMSSLAYVACTRAKHMLYIFVKKGDAKAQAMHEALDSIKSSGALVIDPSEEQGNNYIGVVTHFNPDRVGWISVDDGASKNMMMFFPSDLKKLGLAALKIGEKVIFRPRQEGFATIAVIEKIAETKTPVKTGALAANF